MKFACSILPFTLLCINLPFPMKILPDLRPREMEKSPRGSCSPWILAAVLGRFRIPNKIDYLATNHLGGHGPVLFGETRFWMVFVQPIFRRLYSWQLFLFNVFISHRVVRGMLIVLGVPETDGFFGISCFIITLL